MMGLFRRKTPGGVLDHEAAAPEPEPDTGPDAGPDERAAIHAGVPGRCPLCDGFGYIDNIDMRSRIQTQHCRDCGHPWEFRFDEDGDVIDLRDSAMSPREGSREGTRSGPG